VSGLDDLPSISSLPQLRKQCANEAEICAARLGTSDTVCLMGPDLPLGLACDIDRQCNVGCCCVVAQLTARVATAFLLRLPRVVAHGRLRVKRLQSVALVELATLVGLVTRVAQATPEEQAIRVALAKLAAQVTRVEPVILAAALATLATLAALAALAIRELERPTRTTPAAARPHRDESLLHLLRRHLLEGPSRLTLALLQCTVLVLLSPFFYSL
jgi:hypothetical protein